MVVQTERRVLWHPRLDNRFLVGSASQVTLYEWLAESSEIRHVTSNHGQDATATKVPRRLMLLAETCLLFTPSPVRGLVS